MKGPVLIPSLKALLTCGGTGKLTSEPGTFLQLWCELRRPSKRRKSVRVRKRSAH